ncbi:glycoside hydrolase family 5 protein [Lactococcus fujiensis]|uniref:Glycoside hydrolase family 5 domain-containing protein n=2 Tax=Lactococcus fujiensis TaxID=610251 RepID=A0A2A5RJA4_9LACT|nr:cellulase family glycosylhydrolase [Lactococcus fujiensis]PCR99219.1 hypothetical protein RT41_GL000410 [Lactococcus fujiensis JCM 16395]
MTKNVNGFIRSSGKVLVNDGGEIQLTGWGIGNWLLCEGYMWDYQNSSRLDRPRRIEAVVRELIGSEKSEQFWQTYRENYFNLNDVKRIKKQGYNSIRLPLNWRLFMEEEPGIHFIESGFEIIDEVIKWCQNEDMYLWLDLHGAPGGQTGANIDDSIDDVPRLLLDADSFEKGLALWEEIAKRYASFEVIAGYDLLNEPIRTADPDRHYSDCEFLVPELIRFYEEAIQRIRQHDSNHCISIEGHHWATDTRVFDRQYDSNWVIHFHRYWDAPFIDIFEPFLALSEKFQVPLWLGETGENRLEWFAAVTGICDQNKISYHFWPYKKMGNDNCSVEIKRPNHWDDFIAYSKGGKKIPYQAALKLFNEYLRLIKTDHAILHDEVDQAILRNGTYRLNGINFDGHTILQNELNNESRMETYALSNAGSIQYLKPNFNATKLCLVGKSNHIPAELAINGKGHLIKTNQFTLEITFEPKERGQIVDVENKGQFPIQLDALTWIKGESN